MFIEYPKIHRYGKEEVEGILDFPVTLEEKIDGANTSIWKENGELHMGSRTQEKFEGSNGFVDYVKGNFEIQHLLGDHPTYRLYGEWLVRHTIAYNELSYKKFYLFDILVKGDEWDVGQNWLDPLEVIKIADQYSIPHPQVFGERKIMNMEQIMEYVGKTNLGELGEGVVIKSNDFINKWGDRVYAKVVTQKFKEDNAITFGGNNKHSETYEEMYVVNKYATMARLVKIMHKIEPELDRRFDLVHIPRVSGTCYHDMITEEAWDIAKLGKTIDFRALQRLAIKKFIQMFKDVLSGDTSVADTRGTFIKEKTADGETV